MATRILASRPGRFVLHGCRVSPAGAGDNVKPRDLRDRRHEPMPGGPHKQGRESGGGYHTPGDSWFAGSHRSSAATECDVDPNDDNGSSGRLADMIVNRRTLRTRPTRPLRDCMWAGLCPPWFLRRHEVGFGRSVALIPGTSRFDDYSVANVTPAIAVDHNGRLGVSRCERPPWNQGACRVSRTAVCTRGDGHLLQLPAQALATTRDARFDRSNRNTSDGGNASIVEPVDVAQDD